MSCLYTRSGRGKGRGQKGCGAIDHTGDRLTVAMWACVHAFPLARSQFSASVRAFVCSLVGPPSADNVAPSGRNSAGGEADLTAAAEALVSRVSTSSPPTPALGGRPGSDTRFKRSRVPPHAHPYSHALSRGSRGVGTRVDSEFLMYPPFTQIRRERTKGGRRSGGDGKGVDRGGGQRKERPTELLRR